MQEVGQGNVSIHVERLVPHLPKYHREWFSGNIEYHQRIHSAWKFMKYPREAKVFDWTVPKEWNIRDAYMKDSDGQANH